MIFDNIYTDITKAFGNLWKTKQRGNSLEIITPYATTNNRFISVFLTRQGSEFVITDGGWLKSGVYDVIFSEENCFLKVYSHFLNAFEIKEVIGQNKQTYYYLKTKNTIDVPSKVFDLAMFIQNIVSVCEIEFSDKKETETKSRFQSKVNEYLKQSVDIEKLKFNVFLDPNKKELKFNAIFNNTASNFSLINYITGSSNYYYTNSISKANMLFEMADNTDYKSFIKQKVSIIDTEAEGYNEAKIVSYLNHLEHHTNSKLVNWYEKEKLMVILN
ncbi:hypothetical protein [Myroides sp. LoEW2-1]|uniref:hypothetical protein n=1 Tax=Myroides sp. LoEW2-1 TaxID=2683192 RepID=UPI001329CD83|nr:hypothetical protein [Myroides sp. LoEW2-1]MVX37295.1 hypothetical protein [Myroides sp. LoEW2-1]